jgi:hypothetical protein
VDYPRAGQALLTKRCPPFIDLAVNKKTAKKLHLGRDLTPGSEKFI